MPPEKAKLYWIDEGTVLESRPVIVSDVIRLLESKFYASPEAAVDTVFEVRNLVDARLTVMSQEREAAREAALAMRAEEERAKRQRESAAAAEVAARMEKARAEKAEFEAQPAYRVYRLLDNERAGEHLPGIDPGYLHRTGWSVAFNPEGRGKNGFELWNVCERPTKFYNGADEALAEEILALVTARVEELDAAEANRIREEKAAEAAKAAAIAEANAAHIAALRAAIAAKGTQPPPQ